MLRTLYGTEKPGAMKNGGKFYSEALRDTCSLTDLISLMKSRRMKLADWTKAQSVFVEKGKFHALGRRSMMKLPSCRETAP
jgi:hypothetical protein